MRTPTTATVPVATLAKSSSSPATSGSKSDVGMFMPKMLTSWPTPSAVAEAVAMTSTLAADCAESSRNETNFSVPSMPCEHSSLRRRAHLLQVRLEKHLDLLVLVVDHRLDEDR